MKFEFDKKLFWSAVKVTLGCMVAAPLFTVLALLAFTDTSGEPIFKWYIGIGVSAFVSLLVGFPASIYILQQGKHLEIANRKLNQLIRYDQLTGLLSRGTFFDEVALALTNGPSRMRSGAVFFMDLDHFKQINDQYGHAAGDDVLRVFGKVVAAQLREGEIAGRLGGEEFAMFIPGCTEKWARRRAEKLAASFSRERLDIFGREVGCTVSIGVYADDNISSLDAMLSRADKLLYQAKQNGRNRVIAAENLKIAA